MSIISALRTYIKSYSELANDAPVWIDYLGPRPVEYSIDPLEGDKILVTYINGDSMRSYPFAFRSMQSTISQLEKLETHGFYEEFADWLEEQTYSGVLPVLGTGKVAESLEAVGWSYLFREGESNTGIYQIQCRMIYEQKELI